MSPAVLETLYLGTDTNPGTVSDAEWREFVEQVITPNFPEGFTVWKADGQWRDGSGKIVKEGSYVVQVVHDRRERVSDRVKMIADQYIQRFRQEAVLHTSEAACSNMVTSSPPGASAVR